MYFTTKYAVCKTNVIFGCFVELLLLKQLKQGGFHFMLYVFLCSDLFCIKKYFYLLPIFRSPDFDFNSNCNPHGGKKKSRLNDYQ